MSKKDEPAENIIFNPVIYGYFRIKENVYGNDENMPDYNKSVFETDIQMQNDIF